MADRPIRSRLCYDATDVAVDALPEQQAAAITFLTRDEVDLTLILSREILVRLRFQIDAALTPKEQREPRPE